MKKLALVLAVVLTLGLFSVANAECNPGDLYCQGWSRNNQAQKNRIAFLNQRIGEARDGLNIGACDSVCVKAYDDAGGNLLSRFAKWNGLPVDLVVKAYLVTWDERAQSADRLLGAGKWDVQDTGEWLNTFADELRVNHPYFILGERQYCIVADLGGYCPSRW